MGLLVDDVDDADIGEPDRPAEHTVLLVAGTVTDALAPAVQALIAELPEGSSVVSFGACAGTGGPYWDAPTVTKGVDQLVPVALYVPGCPPRPDALVAGLRALASHDRSET
jgi:NADH-quinone oxidoreductase subunit B